MVALKRIDRSKSFPSRPASIVLADDHIFMRDLMARTLRRQKQRYSVVGEVGTAADALDACRQLLPDLLVLDIYLPDRRGTEILHEVRQAAPPTRVLLCTAFPTDDSIVDLARTTADGFVEKTSTWDDFLAAVDHVTRGRRYFCSRSLGILPNGCSTAPAGRPLLSSREAEVVTLIANGLTTKEIAAKLHISAATVETHRSNVMRKLKAKNVADLVSKAFHSGIVTPRPRSISRRDR